MYRSQAQRITDQRDFPDVNAYLYSLELEVTLMIDEKSRVSRLSQMTQKTNQFNLSTKRYTEQNITAFIDRPTATVFSFAVRDRYGDSGVTGLYIIRERNLRDQAFLDTFLMSCRIIGRGIEFAVLDHLVEQLKRNGITQLSAEYIATEKNQMIIDFLTTAGFKHVGTTKIGNEYQLDLNQYVHSTVDYIKLVSTDLEHVFTPLTESLT